MENHPNIRSSRFNSMKPMRLNPIKALFPGIFLLFACRAGWADSPFLTNGIAAFNKGNYSEAYGLLGAAKPTEFENPVWHYYMANALVKLKQKDEAVKEYKLAMDLAPEGQLKEYCKLALQALQPGVQPVRAANVADRTQPLAPSRATPVVTSQQPQVISVLCGCPLCHRLDLILTDLQSKYGDKVKFTRSMGATPGTKGIVDPDGQLKDVLQKYPVSRCPTVLVFNTQGGLQRTFSDIIPADDLTKVVGDLASVSPSNKFATSSDQHLGSMRDTVVNDYNARVAHDQLRLDQEIKDIEAASQQQINDLQGTRYRGRYAVYDSQSQTQSIQAEAKSKIEALRADFERRKQEWSNEADAKIRALDSVQSSKK